MPHRRPSPVTHPTARLVGQSAAIQALQAQIRRLTAFDTVDNPHAPTLLLQGETGTGKGLAARVIHDSGPRVQGPYIEVNCAAIPEAMLEAELFGFEAGAFTDARRAKPGLFEAASAGTLFLDEIDALPLGLQAKLLTALEEKRVRRLGAVTARQVDVKIIAATQAALADRVAEGRFRADLYHRLTVVLLQLPSLRARGKDILVLAEYFLHHYAAAHRLSPKRLTRTAHDWLLAQAWPGNVRELSHLLERATLLHPGAVLDAHMLQQLCLTQPLSAPELEPDDHKPLDEAARLQRALVQAKGSVVGAARLLGLSRSAMRYRLQRYGLDRSDSPAEPPAAPGEAACTLSMDVPPLEGAAPAPRSEQKLVALLAISLTLPHPRGDSTQVYEPWTTAHRLERSMVEKVQGFGGVVLPGPPSLRFVAFGIPSALEQMPHRAVQTALAIRHLVAETAHTAGGARAPQVRFAVHLGEVLVDPQASPPNGDVLILGDTPTLLMRLVGLAASGDILLSLQVGRVVQDWFALQVRELPDERESPDRVGAYAVLGLRSHHASSPAAFPLSQFVGRERELALFHELFAQVARGHGQVVGLMGEPGVGKSRLLAEFSQQLRARATSQGPHVRCLKGRCVAYGSTIPYLPVRDLLRASFALEEHDDEQTIRATLTATLRALDASLLALVPALLTLLDVPVDDAQWQALEPLQRRQRLLDAAKRLPLCASQQQPLLIMVEDVHWIDEASQAFLDTLIESLPATRILLLVSYRPEYHHRWGSKSFYNHLRLDPLKSEEAHVFLTGLLGAEAPPASPLRSLTRLLLEKAEGNPFFLEESVLTLRETHVLVRERETYRLAQAISTIQVPTTVQAVLAARIDRLPAEAKHLLLTAAVIGLEVSLPLLQAIAGLSETAVYGVLSHLQQAEFLYEARLFPESVYAFKHPLMQEIAYRSLFEQDRQRYHAAVGHYLETLSTDRLDGMVDLLAHHFGRSTEDDKAVEYAMRAAEKAQQRWANSETLAYLEAAVVRLEAMPDTLSNRLRQLDAVLKQAEARFALGQHTEHMAALEGIRTLVDEAPEPRYRATWAYWMGFLHIFAGSRPEVAIAYCQEASTVAKAGGFNDIRAMTDACLAQAYVCAGDLREAVAAGERAIETFEARGHVWWACRALWQLIQAANALGEWQQSLAYCRRALEYGQTVDDLRLKVVGWGRMGSTYIQQGNVEQGLQCCEEALALSPAPYDEAMIKAVRGHGWVKGGKEEAGTAELTAAVARFEQLSLGYTRAVFTLRLGEAYLRQGERLRACSFFQEVLVISQESGYRYLAGVAERFLGESLVVEHPAAAAVHLAGAVQRLEKVGARNEMAKGWVAQATLRHHMGDLAGAREILERALILFERLGTLDEPCRVRAALATLQDQR